MQNLYVNSDILLLQVFFSLKIYVLVTDKSIQLLMLFSAMLPSTFM